MGRSINRVEDSEWEQLTKQLHNYKEAFQKLLNKSLLNINFDNEEIKNAIKKVYNSVKIKHIGATAISKILHLLNPELFVMWDDDIRKKYKVAGNEKGYLEFLKLVKREIEEVIEDKAKKIRCSKEEIIKRICQELPSNKLGKEYKRKSLAKLIDEYNWWVVRYGKS
ncbi:MAG: hypothetical protein QXI49_07555 [Candidatus Methanomethylicaceae archaeon]